MANGYIGKISAVVTANTSDLSRKLQGAVKDVDRFAQTLNRSVSASAQQATASLEKIFTPLQRLERKLQTALQLNLRTDDEVRKIQQLVSVAEGINKPLERAAGSFSKLSLEVQGSFLPALNRAQDSVVLLSRKLNETGSVSTRAFSIVEQSVARTSAAIQRLGEVQRLVSSGPTANSLSLAAPRVSQALQASAAARQQASQLPASALADGRVARQVGNLSAVENRIAEVQARIESLQLRPKVDTVQLEAARKELDRLLAGADRIRAGIQVRIDAQEAIADATSLNQRLDELQENATFSITGTPQNLKQVEAELVRILGQFDRLTEAQRQPLGDQFTKVVESLRAGNLTEAIQNFQTLAANVELAANETERLARANKQLTIAPDQPPPAPPPPSPADLARGGAERIRRLTGNLNLDSTPVPGVFNQQAQRDIDALGARVGQVRQQLETLPNSLRTQFIPALQQAQQQLIALQNSPAATVQQIENAANAVQRLEQRARGAAAALNFRVSFGGTGTAGIESALNERALQGYSAQLGVLQQALGRVSAEARGPALQSFARLRDAISIAMEQGTLETAGTREQIRALTREAVNATSAVTGVGRGVLSRQVQRAGDVGRLGFGNASLALNQLVFAVDDFFSVTGSAEQRIRALGNNITQFGFIVGGTAGLVAGLAAVLVAQGIVAFIRYSNGGATAEDQTKALNDALQRQRTLVDELAQSFESLADSLTGDLFTDARQELEEFREAAREIGEQQRASRDERVIATSPNVFRERSIQQRLDREIQAETNLARRQALERQRRESADIERRLVDRVRNAPAPTGEELQRTVQRQVDFLGRFQRDTTGDPSPRLNLIGQAAGRLPAGQGTAQRREQLAQLDEILGVLKPVAADTFLGIRTLAARAVENTVNILEQQAALVERELSKGVDADSVRSLEVVRTTAIQLAKNVSSLEEAVAANISGAAGALAQAEDLGAELQAARDRLKEARETEGVRERADAVQAASREVANIEAAVRARQDEFLALNQARQSVEAFAAALDRISTELANTVAQEARSAADQARRDANSARGLADAGLGRRDDADAAGRRFGRLGRNAQAAEAQAAEIRADNIRRRVEFERQAAAGDLGDRAQRLIARRNAAQAVLDDRGATAEQRLGAEAVLEVVRQGLQAAFEQSGLGQAAAAQADRFNREQAAVQQREDLIQRGRELSELPGAKAGRELADELRAINASFDERAQDIRDNDPLGARDNELARLQRDRQAALNRTREERLRQEAPAIFGFADAVQNAILQGPSRAALQATDVSTVEGASELNRLLRGDDAARNQDLVQLQREANRLLQVIADGGGANVAN